MNALRRVRERLRRSVEIRKGRRDAKREAEMISRVRRAENSKHAFTTVWANVVYLVTLDEPRHDCLDGILPSDFVYERAAHLLLSNSEFTTSLKAAMVVCIGDLVEDERLHVDDVAGILEMVSVTLKAVRCGRRGAVDHDTVVDIVCAVVAGVISSLAPETPQRTMRALFRAISRLAKNSWNT